MILPKIAAAPIVKLLGPGHFIMHIDAGAVSIQPVVGDRVLDDKGVTVGSLLNLTLMCEQIPHA